MGKSPTETVWERIKAAYTDLHGKPPSQVQIAAMAGVKQPSVSDWNKPGKYPDLGTAISLALRLKVCTEWLLTGREPKRPVPADPQFQRLHNVWPTLTDLERAEIIGIAVGMAGKARDGSGRKPGAML